MIYKVYRLVVSYAQFNKSLVFKFRPSLTPPKYVIEILSYRYLIGTIPKHVITSTTMTGRTEPQRHRSIAKTTPKNEAFFSVKVKITEEKN